MHDVVDACATQKSGKAVGLDGVAMEAFMCGSRVRVHLTNVAVTFARLWFSCTNRIVMHLRQLYLFSV